MAIGLYWYQARRYQDLVWSDFTITLRRTLPAAGGMLLVIQGIRTPDLAETTFVLLAVAIGGLVYLVIYLLVGGREYIPFIAEIWRE